jgi:hypothetical protein
MDAAEPVERMMMAFKHTMAKKKPKRQFMPPSWKSNIR